MKSMINNMKSRGLVNGILSIAAVMFAFLIIAVTNCEYNKLTNVILGITAVPAAAGIALIPCRNMAGPEARRAYMNGVMKAVLLLAAPAVVFIWWALGVYFGGGVHPRILAGYVLTGASVAAIAGSLISILRGADGKKRRAFTEGAVAGAAAAVVTAVIVLITKGRDASDYYRSVEFAAAMVIPFYAALTVLAAVFKVRTIGLGSRPEQYDGFRVMLETESSVVFEGIASRNTNGVRVKGYMFVTGDRLYIRAENGASEESNIEIRLKDVKAVGRISRTRFAVCTIDGGSEYIDVPDADEWVRAVTRAAIAANGGRELVSFESIFAVKNAVIDD